MKIKNLSNQPNDQNMKYVRGLSFIASSIVSYVLYTILDYLKPQIITSFLNLNGVSIFLLLSFFAFLGLAGYGIFLILKEKYGWFSSNSITYTPNHQEYWNHIEKIRKSLEEDITKFNKSNLSQHFLNEHEPDNFYEVIKKSNKKTELLQHLFTHFTYPEQRKGDSAWNLFVANMFEKNKKMSPEWKAEAIRNFNKEFQHIYEIMGDSKPLVGLCDGCKMDYYGLDKEKCLIVLENFHRDRNGMIRKLFNDYSSS